MSVWSMEHEAILRQYWGTMRAANIAALVGREKNAVIGKAHRLNLPPIRAAYPPSGKPRARRRNPFATVFIHNFKRRPEFIKPAAPVIEPPKQPEFRNLTLMQLGATTCRWPFGDRPYLFCGAECPETEPYCRYHASLAYRPAVKRREVNRRTARELAGA